MHPKIRALDFKSDGTRIFIRNEGNDHNSKQYDLTTPWDYQV